MTPFSSALKNPIAVSFFCALLSLCTFPAYASPENTEYLETERTVSVVQLYKSKKYEEIVQLYKNTHAFLEEEYLLVAKSFEKTGHLQKSIDIYRDLYQKNRELRTETAYFIAHCYERLGDYTKAAKWYGRIVQNSLQGGKNAFDDEVFANAGLSRLFYMSTVSKSSVRKLKRYKRVFPLAYYYLGMLSQRNGDQEGAAGYYSDILKDSENPYKKLVLIELIQDKRVINSLEKRGIKKIDLLDLYIKSDLYDEALILSYQLGRNKQVLWKRAFCYYKIGDFETAALVYKDYYELYGNPEAFLKIAYANFYSGDLDGSYSYLQKYRMERSLVWGEKNNEEILTAEAHYLLLKLVKKRDSEEQFLKEVEGFVRRHSDYPENDMLIYDSFYHAVHGKKVQYAVHFLLGTFQYIRSGYYQAWASYILGIYYDMSFLERAVTAAPGSFYYFKALDYLRKYESSHMPAKGYIKDELLRRADRLFESGNLRSAMELYLRLYSRGFQKERTRNRITEILQQTYAEQNSSDWMYESREINSWIIHRFYDLGLFDDLKEIIHLVFPVSGFEDRMKFHYLLSKVSYETGDIYRGIHHAESMFQGIDRRYTLFLPDYIFKLLYPSIYAGVIESHLQSAEKSINANFILALIREESRYKHNAISSQGASGLMQLMPDTASWILRKPVLEEDLFDPSLNIYAGIKYLNYLFSRFDSIEEVLAAYNGGPNNVRKWLASKQYRSTETFIEEIPYNETRNFVKKVYTSFRLYEER